MARKLTLKTLLKHASYGSIFILLVEFQDKEFRGHKGLSLLQFRYVLEKGYKNTKTQNTQLKNNLRDCKDFYGDHLKRLIEQTSIALECINSKQAVMKHLRTLELSVKGLEHIGHRYKLKPEFYIEYLKLKHKSSIDFYSLDQCFYVPHNQSFNVLYGIPKRLLSKKDRNVIEEEFQQIDKILDKIRNIKDKLIADEHIKRIDQWISTTKSDRIKQLIGEYGNLLYDGICLYTVHEEDYVKLRKLHGKRPWNWSEVHFGKDFGFTQSEIDEIKNWRNANQDIMLQQRPMSYAKFW